MRLRLSKSGIELFLRCPRAWYYKYVLGRVPLSDSKSVDLNFGKAFHDSRELWAPQFELYDLPPDEIIKGEELFRGYQNTWEKPSGEVEKEFEIDCGEFDYVGVFDEIGNTVVTELKTTRSWINNDYWNALPMNMQLRLYAWAANHLTGKEHAVVWDVTQRCKLKQGPLESDTKYRQRVAAWVYKNRDNLYQRRKFSASEIPLHEAKKVLDGTSKMIQSMTEYFQSGNCRAFGRLCGYNEVCNGEEEITSSLYTDREQA